MHPAAPSIAPRRTATWVYVAVILGILFLFMSLLLVAGSLLALNHVGVIGTPDVPPTDGISADMDAYASSLGNQSATQDIDPELRKWLEDHSDEPNGYIEQELPFDKKLFMQAVAQSPQATSIGIEARLTMVAWLDEYFPQPETLDNYSIISTERVLDPTTNEPSDFAVINLYFYYGYYEGFSEGMSSRWYLHKDTEGWKLYDTQRLELGRRTSDEWAHYLSNINSPFADAYDESKAELVDTYNIDVIRKEEKRKVLPKDFPVKQLLVAQAYQQIEAYDEALRVLETITDPEMRWGVLTTKSYVLSAIQRYDEAIASAEELLAISPNHPNGLYAICGSLESAKRYNELRPYLLRLVRICPNDWNAMEQLVKIATPDDLGEILASSVDSTNPDGAMECLLERCFDRDKAFPAALKNWQESRQTLSKVPESSWKMIEAAEKFASGDAFAAAESLHRTAAEHPDSRAASYLEDLINNATWNAYLWCDPNGMTESDRLFSTVETPTLLSLIANTQNNVRSQIKVDESMAAIIARMSEGSGPDVAQWGYAHRYRLDGLISTLFQFGYLDEVQRLVDGIEGNDEWNEKVELERPLAGLLLYRERIDELLTTVSGWEPDAVSTWLGEPQIREYLYANPGTANRLLSELIPGSPMDYWSSSSESVIVFNRESARPDEPAVRAWVESVIDVPFVFAQVPTTTSDKTKGLATWKVSFEDGLQILITVSETQFDDSYIESAEVISTLQSSNHVVVVETVSATSLEFCRTEGNLFADQALAWEIARQSVSDDTLGVFAWRNGAFWKCDSQSHDDLRWDSGFPKRSDAITSNYITTRDNADDTENISLDELEKALSTRKTDVQCRFRATVATEVVNAELLRVEAETETADIQLTADSQFFPALKAGQKLNCSIYELYLKD